MTLFAELGLRYPIIQAPMAGVQDSALALAVTRAGALGSLPAAMLSLATLREELTRLAASGEGPFNINFFCHRQEAPDPAAQARWLQRLTPYYDEYGVRDAAGTAAPSRAPFNAEHAAMVAEFKPAVVSFHFGLPEPELLARVKASGAKVLASATTVAEARWLADHGADAVIAQGLEAGGHRGHFLKDDLSLQQGTFSLLPQIVETVRLPVIAAGGIVDGAGIRAALALGAIAVQMGTAFLCCHEATTSALHRAALHSPAGRHTALTNLFSGRPARGIVNRLMRELGSLSDLAPDFPHASSALAPLRAAAEKVGESGFSPLWAGQNVSGCIDLPASELIAAWVKEAGLA
ncbi:NAD(P)H-dependent flavin oxidoreductase [Aeromonas hydrophila]|uniref:NAD(P)H-dependent flavin oxidoreductase n=1 Tax=Aeromonas hydrophila TaxID=644 RepID=UPI000332AED3|nr:nitronate monooxygenase [Aeromonas hydrophila]AGM42556.1 2-nitropropane dioxygenase [Aeromonas hydrophila ML09-119]AHX31277.1 2-nitropropane dioxygenase [Aeromonas hydrophila subsp. hydrophila AL09-71]AHX68072.1 2-nitropropane dioxygenase [Aeromonas hydrophila pc104A]AJE37877.1 2-nitropropane dioxygenase [Aeromonas hydrophila J-1]AKJ36174.1 2-nitropropane dioxygenase [Aeromonas hydrophila NJ-35]